MQTSTPTPNTSNSTTYTLQISQNNKIIHTETFSYTSSAIHYIINNYSDTKDFTLINDFDGEILFSNHREIYITSTDNFDQFFQHLYNPFLDYLN